MGCPVLGPRPRPGRGEWRKNFACGGRKFTETLSGPRDPLKLSAEWRQSTILKMVLCAEWRQLQEWRRLAEDNPHGHEIIRLMQVRGDREQQPPADVASLKS